MTNTNTVEIVEVALWNGTGSRWIVKVNGTPVANYGTLSGAQRKAGRL